MSLLWVPGTPVQWARPRARGKQFYTAAPQKAKIEEIRLLWGNRGKFMRDIPVTADLGFFFPRPSEHFKANGDIKDRFVGRFKTTKPDLDNLVKLVMDALTGYGFDDDNQVVSISAYKGWVAESDTQGSTVIGLRRFQGDTDSKG